MEYMETIAISKKKYRELMAAKARLDALFNIKPWRNGFKAKHTTVDDLVGMLRDVKMFKGKTSVEVQKMIPELWAEKYL